MTVKELRRLLFDVDNQDLKVKELRKLLFDVDNQEQEVSEVLAFITKNSNK